MNEARRKVLTKALGLIDEGKSLLEAVRDEEQEAFDGLPEGLQQSEKGEKMEEAIGHLNDAIDNCESATGSIDEACS